MPSVFPPGLLRVAVGVVIASLLVCPRLWGGEIPSGPKVLTWQWYKHLPAQLTGVDLTWDGYTVALTIAPLDAEGENRLYVYDVTGQEVWTVARGGRMLGVSLSADGDYLAVGRIDFSVTLFSRAGELLWERKSVGLPRLTASGDFLIAFNSGITGLSNTLFEVFRRNGEKAWSIRRQGRVWRAIVSDQNDVLLGLWNGEVLLIDRRQRILSQQFFGKDVMALAVSPGDAQYFAVGTGVLGQSLHLFERTGRPLWRRKVPYGVTEVSLAKQGAFLLSYGNTVNGQQLALYNRNGDVQWTYHLNEPAMESSKAVIVPNEPLVVAGIERDHQYYLQGFALTGELLWIAPVPEPIFDFRVSRDGRYIAAATDHAVYFFDTHTVVGPKAQLHE
jgi:outer membrane protein assembly factor BamB